MFLVDVYLYPSIPSFLSKQQFPAQKADTFIPTASYNDSPVTIITHPQPLSPSRSPPPKPASPLQTRRRRPRGRLALRINLQDRRARETRRGIDARGRGSQNGIDLAGVDGGDLIDLVVGVAVGDAGGDEGLLQAGEEDGVDLRGGGEVVGLLGGGEGALEGDGGAVGSVGG